MKKMLALLLAMLMAFGLTAPAFALETAVPAAGLVDAVPYTEPDHGNFVSEEVVWMENHPDLVAAFRTEGYVEYVIAQYGYDAPLDTLWHWKTQEEAIEDLLISWVWEMIWLEAYLADAVALKAENPAQYAEYAAQAETYFYKHLWYASVEEFKGYHYGVTDEQFVDFMVGYQIEDAQWRQEKIDAVAKYRSEHPGELEAIDWKAYFYDAHWYYDSFERYMRDNGFTTEAEAYAELQYQYVSEQNWQAELAVYRAEFIAEKRAALGLPAEGYAVMVNGDFLTFSQPLTVRHGSIYAPAEELAKAIGLTSSYADLLVDGQLPVRLAGERAGYTVFWDEILDAAVLIDLSEIVAALDEQFTILNRVLTRAGEQRDKDGSGTVDMALTLLDSLDGDKTYTAKLAYTFGWKEETTYWLKGSLTSPNFAEISELIKSQFMTTLWYYSEAELAQFEQIFKTLGALKSIDFAVEYNMETGYVTISLPLMATLGRLMGESVEPVQELFVGKVDLDTPSFGALMAQLSLSVVESEYSPYFDYEFEYDDSPVYYWGKLQNGLPTGMDIFADSAFTRKGSEDVIELTATDLLAMMAGGDDYYAEYYAEELKRMLPKFHFTLAINDKGESRVSFEMRVDAAAMMGSPIPVGPTAEVTAESKDAGNTQESTFNIHVKNTLKFELKSKVVYK